jgi:hypothetical protein
MELKQYCPYCSGKIAYPSEMAGSSTACPHCQREVELDREIKQECRACGEKVGFPESLLGESVACPHCGKSMKLHRSVADAFKQASAGRDTGSSVQYFLHMGGKVEGPLTEAEVCGLVEQGNIRQDTMARMGDANEWVPLGQLSQFTASFQKQNTPTIQEEAPSAEGPAEIMLMVKGAQHGPYTIGQIMHGLKTGTVDSHTPANRPGLPGWIELRQWSEFQDIARRAKETFETRKFTRNPHAVDCLGSGLCMSAIIFAMITAELTKNTSASVPVTHFVIAWVLSIGWMVARGHLVRDSDSVGEDFGSRDLLEIVFHFYFYLLIFITVLSFIGVLFTLAKGMEHFLLATMVWSVKIPMLYLNWNGVRGMKRYFQEYERSGIDLVMVIIGSIPLIIGNGLIVMLFIIIIIGAWSG